MKNYTSELIKNKINDNTIIAFDVGAKSGVLKLGKLDEHIKYYGFEPNEIEFQKLNNKDNVEYFPFALGEMNGVRDLYITKHSSFSSFLQLDKINFNKHFGLMKEYPNWIDGMSVKNIIPVKVRSLDSITKENKIQYIDFLKMDTQGTELEILKGGKNFLRSNKVSMIYAEFSFIKSYKNQNSFSEMELYLKQFGYECIDCRFYPNAVVNNNIKLVNKKIYDEARFSVGGDAIFILDVDKDMMEEKALFKLGLLTAQLGYLSIASHILKKCNLKEAEINVLLKELNSNKLSAKQIAIDLCPPFLYKLLKEVKG